MARVDALFAQWLQNDADRIARRDDAVHARWGASAVVADRLTGIATRTDADAEAARQLAFFAKAPFAIDVHEVPSVEVSGILGRVITLTVEELGYDTGVDVFVLAAEIDRARGMSALTVLTSLADLS